MACIHAYTQASTASADGEVVEVEYVAADDLGVLDVSDPAYEEFQKIFGAFSKPEVMFGEQPVRNSA